jgi:hypothetical protein
MLARPQTSLKVMEWPPTRRLGTATTEGPESGIAPALHYRSAARSLSPEASRGGKNLRRAGRMAITSTSSEGQSGLESFFERPSL